MSNYIWSGIVRSVVAAIGHGIDRPLPLTTNGSLAVAQVESPNSEQLRMGLRFWGGCQVIANGIAPVTAIPTTSPSLALYNSATATTGKCLIVDFLSFFLGSGTPTAGATLLTAVSNGVIAAGAPSAATNYSSKCASGDTTKSSAAVWATSITFPASSVWVAARPGKLNAAVNFGQGEAPLITNGLALVPPGYALGMAIMSETGTTPLFVVSAAWNENSVVLG